MNRRPRSCTRRREASPRVGVPCGLRNVDDLSLNEGCRLSNTMWQGASIRTHNSTLLQVTVTLAIVVSRDVTQTGPSGGAGGLSCLSCSVVYTYHIQELQKPCPMAQLESFYSHQLSEILSENPWSQGSNDLFSPTLNEWDLVWNGREGNAEDACQSGSPSDSNATTNPHWQQYATNLYATTDTQNEYGQGGQELVADNTVHQGSGATVYDNSGPFFSSVMPPAGFENQPLYLPSVSQCHQPPLLPTTTSTYREPDNTVTLPQACPAPLRASGWPSQPQPEVFRYYKPPLPSRLSTPYSETSSRTVSPSVPPTSSKKTRSTAKPYRRSDHDEFDLALAALNRPPQPYPCVCGEIVYEANLACHLKERHGLTGKNLLCPWPECETTLQDVSALRRHCLTAQGHLGKKTPCPACLNEFTRSDRARSHFFNNCPVRGSLSRGSSGPSKVKRTGKTRRSR